MSGSVNSGRQVSRRQALRGLGTVVALPFLESLLPAVSLAGGLGAKGASAPPVRMAFLFVPNGVHIPDWVPQGKESAFELPYILEPLSDVKRKLLVLSGLTHDKGRPNGDAAGDHARGTAAFLTGMQPVKTHGANIRLGISVDQVAAHQIGDQTRLPSLELTCDSGRNSGNCDSGYSCAYSNNISWTSPTTPMAKEVDPRNVFDRLFAGDSRGELAERRARKLRRRKSILDFVLGEQRRLATQVSGADRRKLDEYLTGVREIERRVDRAQPVDHEAFVRPESPLPEAGQKLSYADHLRLMSDMLVLAFQGDVTRIATFMFARAGSNRSYPWLDVAEGHHSLSHHGGDPKKHAKIRKINRFHTEQLAYLLTRLDGIKEGDGTLLDNCMIVYGSGLSDGNAHNNENLPVVLAGGAGGVLDTGRHVAYPLETPMCNLFVSMLEHSGSPVDRFGDSTGPLEGLVV